jgi:hypothetical protein
VKARFRMLLDEFKRLFRPEDAEIEGFDVCPQLGAQRDILFRRYLPGTLIFPIFEKMFS